MHRLWRKRGRRIRPNDKDLVFRTVFFLLFAVFAVAFVLLNIRTDWRPWLTCCSARPWV